MEGMLGNNFLAESFEQLQFIFITSNNYVCSSKDFMSLKLWKVPRNIRLLYIICYRNSSSNNWKFKKAGKVSEVSSLNAAYTRQLNRGSQAKSLTRRARWQRSQHLKPPTQGNLTVALRQKVWTGGQNRAEQTLELQLSGKARQILWETPITIIIIIILSRHRSCYYVRFWDIFV